MQRTVGGHPPGAETFELGLLCEKKAFRKRAVQAPHAVKAIISGHEIIAGVGDSLDVTRVDLTRHTNQCKVFFCHGFCNYSFRCYNLFFQKIFPAKSFGKQTETLVAPNGVMYRKYIIFILVLRLERAKNSAI